MRHALRTAGARFTAQRMVRDYVTEYYLPAMRGEQPADDPPTAGGSKPVEGQVGATPPVPKSRRGTPAPTARAATPQAPPPRAAPATLTGADPLSAQSDPF